MKIIETLKNIKKLKTTDFFLNCNIPMGYTAGYPIIRQTKSGPCICIPYLKYKVTGEVDKTLVFPIKYIITLSLPNFSVVGFEDLEYNSQYKNVDFLKPTGYFRHDAIKSFSKKEYQQKREILYSMYDKFLSACLYNTPYTVEDDQNFKNLLSVMVEPCLYPIYENIDSAFFSRYLR